MTEITIEKFKKDIKEVSYLLAKIIDDYNITKIYGIPKGGLIVALALQSYFKGSLELVDKNSIDKSTLIVDDLIDSGKTLSKKEYKDCIKLVLYRKPHSPILENVITYTSADGWIKFFYEDNYIDIGDNITRILEYVGDNPCREGLLETPERVVRMYDEIFSGYNKNPEDLFKKVFTSNIDEMVIVKDISYYSHCEHHMVPFFGKVHIGYLPNGKVLGLSKFARLVEVFSKRLQIQERLTQQIGDSIETYLKPLGVMVVVEGEHLCMSMRGIKKPGHKTITSFTTGKFRNNINARQEFLTLIGK